MLFIRMYMSYVCIYRTLESCAIYFYMYVSMSVKKLQIKIAKVVKEKNVDFWSIDLLDGN